MDKPLLQMPTRRKHLMGLLTGMTACLTGYKPKAAHAQQQTDTEDIVLRHRFRGVRGGEKRIDAVLELHYAFLYIDGDPQQVFASGSFGQHATISSYGGYVAGDQLVVPRTLRYVLFPNTAKSRGFNAYPPLDGAPLTDVTVPVASRIPEDLLEDLRRDPKGSLRLKLRMLPSTLLVGWDIERRPGFDKKKPDAYGEAVYVAPVHSFAGGDFREAKIFNGQVTRKGWYIDPKSSERIETDF